MKAHFIDWWQSTLAVGSPLFPYFGLAVLTVVLVAGLAAMFYIVWRVSRRLPPVLRYLGWRIALLFQKIRARKAGPTHGLLMARLTVAGDLKPLNSEFFVSRWNGATSRQRRPKMPLWVVLGMSDAACDSVIWAAAQGDGSGVRPSVGFAPELTWWQLDNRLALQVPVRMTTAAARAQLIILQRTLVRLNKRRPLDGLVVVVSANTLLTSVEEPTFDDLVRSVASWSAFSDFRLPVYVVVAEMEKLPGYTDFARILADAGGSELLGWRNEQPEASRLEPAIERWFQSLRSHGLAAVAGRAPATKFGELNDAVGIPILLAQLRPRLSRLVACFTGLASQGAAPVSIGGIYLAVEGQNGGVAGWSSDRAPQLWLNQFGFADHLLIRPTAAYLRRSHRRSVAAFLVLLVSAGCLSWWAPRSIKVMQEDARLTMAELDRVRGSIVGGLGEVSQSAELWEGATELLESINKVSAATHARLLAPSSWSGSEHRRVLELLGRALQHKIMKPRLELLSNELSTAPMQGGRVAVLNSSAERVEELPAHEALRHLLESREMAGNAVRNFQYLSSGVTYQEFYRFLGYEPTSIGLVDWSWDQPLPDAVTDQLDVSRLATQEGDEQEVRQLVEDHWNRLLTEALDGHPIRVMADELRSALDRLAQAQEITHAEALQMGVLLQRIRREVDQPSARRLLGKQTETMAFFNPVLMRMGRSPVVPMAQAAEMSGALIKRRESIRKRLQLLELSGVGPMFAVDPDGVMSLSPDVKRFALAYGALMTQRFMQPVAHLHPPRTAHFEAGIRWDTQQLEVVKTLAASVQEFSTTGLSALDPTLRPGLMRLAHAQARLALDSAFWKAAQPESARVDIQATLDPVGQLRPQVAALLSAIRVYRQSIPETLQNRETGRLLADEGQRLLTMLELLLKTEDPYGSIANEIRGWMAQPSPAKPLAAFVRASAKERLGLARDYVRMQYGLPVAQLMEALTPLADLTRTADSTHFWQRLLNVLEAHDKSANANGLFEFEQYVQAIGKWGSPDDCVRFLGEREPSAGRSDYFSHRLSNLEDLVQKECDVRIATLQRVRYEELARWFNERVAGHSPFGDGSALEPLSRRSFATAMQRYRELRRPIGELQDASQPVMEFLYRMDEVAARFSPPLPMAGGKPMMPDATEGIVRARLELRSKAVDAVLTEHIIDVNVTAGSRRYGLHNAQDVFEWRPGDAIEVRLRWAANSPFTPAPNPGRLPRYTVVDRTAVFRFEGDWALPDLLKTHQVRGDRYVQATLQWPVVVVGPSGRETARLIMRVLSESDLSPLALDFPQRAPFWLVNPVGDARIAAQPIGQR